MESISGPAYNRIETKNKLEQQSVLSSDFHDELSIYKHMMHNAHPIIYTDLIRFSEDII